MLFFCLISCSLFTQTSLADTPPRYDHHVLTALENAFLSELSLYCSLSDTGKCTFLVAVDQLAPHTAVVITSSACTPNKEHACPAVGTTRYSVDNEGPLARCAETGHDCEINIYPIMFGKNMTAALVLRNSAEGSPTLTDGWAWSLGYGVTDA